MKKKKIFGLVAIVTVIALNVQWLGLANSGYLFNLVNAGGVGGEGGGGFDINIGYDLLNYLYDEGTLVVEDVEPTVTVSNPATAGITKLNCEWSCGESYWFPEGFYAIPEMCTEGHLLVLDIEADIAAGRTGDWDGAGEWGANSVYDAGEKVSWDGLWVWERYNITTGIGWTAWWEGLADYCEVNGWWSDSNEENIFYGSTVTLTFTIAENIVGSLTYDTELLAKDTVVGLIRMQGSATGTIIAGGQTVTTPSFNSPFIYFDNMPAGDYTVALDSDWGQYQSVTPTFTNKTGWDVEVGSNEISVAGQAKDHLFYELAMNHIDLSRNGVNFSSKERLEEFLEESEFFAGLNMTTKEKQNSLGYLLPRLKDASNYYLTILTDEAVSSLSQLEIEPKPEQLVRTYYAVYPTVAPVSVEGGLVYPESFDSDKSTVKEYGEIIVKPEMHVFWK